MIEIELKEISIILISFKEHIACGYAACCLHSTNCSLHHSYQGISNVTLKGLYVNCIKLDLGL